MKLFFREWGGANEETLVILHGLFGSSQNWMRVGKELAEKFHVYALDLPNHGESPHVEEHTYESMMKAVVVWMGETGLNSAHFIGHSMGGKVAMFLACRHPERVKKIVIVDVAPKTYPTVEPLELKAMESLDLKKIKSREEVMEDLQKFFQSEKLRKFILTNLVRDKNGKFSWKINLEAIKKYADSMRQTMLKEKDRFLGEALFIHAKDVSYVLPEDYPKIKKHFPKALIVGIPNVGHNVHIDAPESFVKEVKNFVS